MRGVDLAAVRFDYDLTWAAFVMDADGRVYARYGSRESTNAEDHLSLAGLKHTLGAVIFVIALVFVYRSFYSMRIPLNSKDADVAPHQMQKG